MDSRWADKQLGRSGLTCRRFGCYATFAASVMAGTFNVLKDDRSGFIDPGYFIDRMNVKRPDGFPGGQVDWSAVTEIWPDIFLFGRDYTTVLSDNNIAKVKIDTAMQRCVKMLRMGMGVGLMVNNVLTDNVKPDHIVAMVDGSAENPLDWKIMDPDGGQVITFASKYGDPRTNLYGYRIIVGPPTDFPPASGEMDKINGTSGWKAECVRRGRNVDAYAREISQSIFFPN